MTDSFSANILTGLRCKSCRFVLFDNKNIFAIHKKIKPPSKHSINSECSHYFLNEDSILANSLKWIEDQIQTGAQEGIIKCGKCSHKLGSFNWQGKECGCDNWQIPAIGIIKSKVDPIRKTGVVDHFQTDDSIVV